MISSALDFYYRLAKDLEAHQKLFMQGELYLEKLEELLQEVTVQRNQIVPEVESQQVEILLNAVDISLGACGDLVELESYQFQEQKKTFYNLILSQDRPYSEL